MLQTTATYEIDPRSSSDYKVEAVSEYDRFLELGDEWNRLVEESCIDHPFLRHEWLRAWWDSFGENNRLEIVIVRDGARLAAAAPLMRNRTRVYGFSVRRWQSIYNAHTPRSGFIVAPGEDGAWRAIWDHIASRKSEWDVVELNQLPAGSRTLAEMETLAGADGFPVGSWWSGDSPYLGMTCDWETYFQGLGRKHRSNMRNRLNRLKKIGRADLELISEQGPELNAAFEEGLAIEAAAWKGRSGTAIRSDGCVRDFYSRLAEAAAREGLLRCHFLKVGERRMAFAYALFYRNKFYLLKTGYDPAYAQFSPFYVLCAKVLEDAFEQGVEEYDFLGVHEPWKRNWTETARPHYWLYVFSNSLYLRFIYHTKFSFIPRLKGVLRLKDVLRIKGVLHFHSTPSSNFSVADGGER